jgi:CubicO group peptidase (beta-lactamase class C family)
VNPHNTQPAAGAINLGNWLIAPFNRVAFRHVRKVLPVVQIANDPCNVTVFETALVDQAQLTFRSSSSEAWTIERFLQGTYTDAFLILRDGRIVFEWYTPGQSPSDEHIVFSVTKSLIGSLAGILVDKGLLDPLGPVVRYVPEVGESGYSGAHVRDLLDMAVGLDLEETPLVSNSPYSRYREAVGWEEIPAGQTAIGMRTALSRLTGNGQLHGTRFSYLSPNSDLLGWICERASCIQLASLISLLIWKPMGAQSHGSITVDSYGAPRAAGGLGCTLRDMARFGECMRTGGVVSGRQVIPRDWVKDTLTQGDRSAWERGAFADWISGGCYRNQWWITNDEQGAYFAAGLYSNWIYISPAKGVVIIKPSSPPIGPADKNRFRLELEAFGSLAERVG